MKMRSPIPKKHARIEIIPLIDIMFFLLASFMMVSLSQTHMKGIRVNLPSAVSRPADPNQKDFTSLRVSEGGLTYIDNVLVDDDQVLPRLYQMAQGNPNAKVSISAEQLAAHGDVITLLDRVRSAGITKIGYQVKAAAPQGSGGAPPPP
ncbi:MAG: biopolymer transporter ExbD [Chthoniobacterales bacterium]|nr:biopolymer transporter ExbD [Chthoniobacterales bacterium]